VLPLWVTSVLFLCIAGVAGRRLWKRVRGRGEISFGSVLLPGLVALDVAQR
jgi:hypothetical protein